MLNRIIICGRILYDPELKTTANGTHYISGTIAVERDFKGQDGERGTDFINYSAWRGTAEFINQYFSKGRMIILDGTLQTRPYKNRDGDMVKHIEVVAEKAYFADSKKAEDSPREKKTEDAAPKREDKWEQLDDNDVDLPF